MNTYIFEYNDAESESFDRSIVRANDLEEAWYKIRAYVGKGSTVLRIFETVYQGEYLVEE